jgi:hypothetical protein
MLALTSRRRSPFDAIVALDDFAQASRIGFAQVAHARVRADTRHFQNLLRRRLANTVDIGQRGFNSFVTGKSIPEIRAILLLSSRSSLFHNRERKLF